MHLEKCIQILGRIVSFDFSSDFTSLNSFINTNSIELFNELNLSILSGEYVKVEVSENKLNELSSINTSVLQIEISEDQPEELIFKIQNELLLPFSNSVNSSIKEYQQLIHRLKRDLKNDDYSLLFEAVSIKQSFSTNRSLELETIRLNHIFLLNIRLATIDHNLSVKKEILRELLIIRNELKQVLISNSFLNKVIADKCNYLIKKIIIKFNEDDKNYLYAFDFEDKLLGIDELTVKYFKDFDEITNAHYGLGENHSQLRRRLIREAQDKKLFDEPISLRNYHALIKEYKDNTKNLSQINNLTNQYVEYYNKIKNTVNQFDRKALDTTYNYIENNKFSFSLIHKDSNDKTIAEKYSKIKDLQADTQIKNYFPSYKYSLYLSQNIDKVIKLSDVDTDKLRENIDMLEDVLKDSYKNYEWCVDKNFLAFQLPFDEAKIEYIEGDNTYSLFLASSFILPVNYEEIKRELNEIRRKLDKFNTLLEVHENLKNEKSIIKDIRAGIEKNDKRSIEILSIFSAIVLYASGSIQIFSKIDSLNQALLFMITFAAGLSTFILLILMIVQPTEKIKISFNKGFIACILICILVISTWLLVKHPLNYNADSTIVSTVKKSVVITQKDTVSQSYSIRTDSLRQRTKTP